MKRKPGRLWSGLRMNNDQRRQGTAAVFGIKKA